MKHPQHHLGLRIYSKYQRRNLRHHDRPIDRMLYLAGILIIIALVAYTWP